ncbi:YTH domain-containing protein 1 [Poecilia reticulata]|uniref:YTH domain-containing protein 1 n=1 Tax=Poecilia reticulata TaxID=8081 RepID=UPI0004A2CBBD|nr:PREDICTED: YTH domain-containing protein 1-like [Poecilia reticulata]XP_017165773.1 PREDICTED: YTH domain-containing protein 1-like [Poecilia reticulata]XP_017165774.1 PREDICTED: YTH domain-containing protein 1-like [Poecilia reticulata]XP_017165775.1 PREDICTED: YTH domain-containing protein 1-like [Poecilia reticulata]XP_017165776.1 PREDICTED: YTH domain-containing protein 1-like [Poecilia reticulata]
MTIGRNSRKTSTRNSVRAPKFLDKSSGFYGRLDESEPATDDGCEISGGNVEAEVKDSSSSPTMVPNTLADEDVEAFGVIEDDGETLLQRKPSRLSSKWRRSTRRKQKDEKAEDYAIQNEKSSPEVQEDMKVKTEEETVKESGLVHFQVREFADDRVLIRDNKRGREEEEEESEEERKMKKEQEEGMKMVKRKNYRKAFDRALRRGWEAFITNLYSVTLTPVTVSSPTSTSPSLKKKSLHSSVLAEFQ